MSYMVLYNDFLLQEQEEKENSIALAFQHFHQNQTGNDLWREIVFVYMTPKVFEVFLENPCERDQYQPAKMEFSVQLTL